MTATTTRRHSAEWYAQQAEGSWAMADKYRKLATLAGELSTGSDGLVDEYHRLQTIADEFDGDAEEMASTAIAKGYQP